MVNRTIESSIKDNRSRGSVGDFLREKIKEDSKLAIVSAYFVKLKRLCKNKHYKSF